MISSLSQQKEKKFWSKMIFEQKKINKTSILWTPGNQVYLSKKKKLFGQQKQIRKMHKSCIIND